MRFDSLPLASGISGQLLAENDAGELTRVSAEEVAQAALDVSMVSLVMSKKTTAAALLSHIGNSAIHQLVDDTSVSTGSIWSSAKINDVITATSNLNLTTDDITEGTVNKYLTDALVDARVQQAAANVDLDYDLLAARVASLMLGFSTKPVLFQLHTDGSETLDEMTFSVLPGVQAVTLSAPASNAASVLVQPPRCPLFAMSVVIFSSELSNNVGGVTTGGNVLEFPPGSSVTITRTWIPKLTLDALSSGTTNKLFTDTELSSSGLLGNIDNHLSASNFARFHNEISDTDTFSTARCWSSLKTESRIREMFDTYNPRSTNKEMALIWCRANQGLNATNHSWTSELVSGLWRHYIRRPLNQSSHHDQLTWNSWGGSITLRPGKYHVSWQASEAVRNVTNVQSIGTYLGTTSGWDTKLLDAPGALTVAANTSVCLWTLIVTPDPYVSSWLNSWLTPRNVPGMQEVYSSLFAERIQ